MASVIQSEMSKMVESVLVLNESIRQLCTDKRLPEYVRLMEIRATNRELLEIAQKIDRARIQLLTARQLQPLDSIESKN